jgi:MFS family permease
VTKVRLLADTRPLTEYPAFRRLWAGSALSAVGGAMTSFAVSLQVYELTHSVAAVGALGLALAIPAIALGLFGGSLADATDRRTLVLVTSGCLAAVSATLAVQAFADLRQLWLLYSLVAVQSLLSAIDNPARRTFVTRLLPASRVSAGVALNQLSFVGAGGPHLGNFRAGTVGSLTSPSMSALSGGLTTILGGRSPYPCRASLRPLPGAAATRRGLRARPRGSRF